MTFGKTQLPSKAKEVDGFLEGSLVQYLVVGVHRYRLVCKIWPSFSCPSDSCAILKSLPQL